MSQHLLLCTECLHTFQSHEVIYYSPSCQPKVHIFCGKCVSKFQSNGTISCKLCKTNKLKFDMNHLPARPWKKIDNFELLGSSPLQIIEAIQKAIQWWEHTRNFNINRYEYLGQHYETQCKLEVEKNASEIKRFKNDINQLIKQHKSLQISMNDYKISYQKAKRKVSTLELENQRKTALFNEINKKYTQMLSDHMNSKNNNINNINYSYDKYKRQGNNNSLPNS
eukprot:81447_1